MLSISKTGRVWLVRGVRRGFLLLGVGSIVVGLQTNFSVERITKSFSRGFAIVSKVLDIEGGSFRYSVPISQLVIEIEYGKMPQIFI